MKNSPPLEGFLYLYKIEQYMIQMITETNINTNLEGAIIILILTAVITGLQYIGKESLAYLKQRHEKREKEKILKIEAKKTGLDKAKEVLKILEDLNKREDIYKEKENQRMLSNNMAVLLNQRKASDIINEVIINTDVERFVLFHTHNGNGQPNYFKPYKVSYLQYNAVDPSHINKYQNIEVDSEYTKMLIDIQDNEGGKIVIKVDDMPECLLKSIYKKEKVKYSEIYFLCATSTGIIYTSLATTRNINSYGEGKYDINIAVAKLKDIFIEEHSRVFRDAILREENETRLKEIFIEKEQLKESLEKDE